MKKWSGIIAFLILVIMLTATTSALAFNIVAMHEIDNDDAQGYTTHRFGFEKMITGNTLAYGDARLQPCVKSSSDNFRDRNRYEYCFWYSQERPIVASVAAYLYNINFTDPRATYNIDSASSYVLFTVGEINQDLAAAGWNEIGEVTGNLPLGNKNYASAVILEPSENSPSKNCGADSIRVRLGY